LKIVKSITDVLQNLILSPFPVIFERSNSTCTQKEQNQTRGGTIITPLWPLALLASCQTVFTYKCHIIYLHLKRATFDGQAEGQPN
jgi:hypothetical protein